MAFLLLHNYTDFIEKFLKNYTNIAFLYLNENAFLI